MSKLLVVVDYQNDFVTGSLGFDKALEIEPKIINIIKEFKDRGDDVVFTMDTHHDNYMDTTEGKNLPVPHCIEGSWGWELTDSIKDLSKNCKVFKKYTFGSKDLGRYIESNDYDEIYLIGIVSDICVFSNALVAKSFAKETANIFVIKDAVASMSEETQTRGFETLKYLHVKII